MNLSIPLKLNKIYLLASVSGSHLQSGEDLLNYHIPFDDKACLDQDFSEIVGCSGFGKRFLIV